MKIRIIETKELKELIILGTNNMDYSNDLLGNHNATTYNEATGEHEMLEEDFTWWNEYIDNHNTDQEEIRELAETYNIDEEEIKEAIRKEMESDLGDEHSITQEVIKVFKQEKKLYLIGKNGMKYL